LAAQPIFCFSSALPLAFLLCAGHGFSVNVIQFKTSRGQVVFSVFVF
jgi:hypothetical protein